MEPSDSFLLEDLRQTALAFGLFPIVLLVPGWVLGWSLDLLGFRSRGTAGRCVLAVCFSVGAAPIVTDLAARGFGLRAVPLLYGGLAVAFVAMRAIGSRRERSPGPRPSLTVLLCTTAWVLLAAASLCDLQIGHTLYVSVTATDYVKHIGVTDAIVRTGVPPANPYFMDGAPQTIYYYYYWHLLCAAVETLGRGALGPRGAAFGGTIWAGLSFLCLLAMLVWFGRETPLRRPMWRLGLLLLLLGVTGLDLLAVAPANVLCFLWRAVPVYEAGESWNEQVTAWTGTLLWVPQHVAALVAWVSAATVLRRSLGGGRREWSAAAYLALAAASGIGLSVWVSLTVGLCLAVWLLVAWARRQTRFPLAAVVGLAGALALVAPFALALARVKQIPGPGIALDVRRFLPLEEMCDIGGVDGPARAIVSLLALPLNYALELGFFGAVGVLYLRRRFGPLREANADALWELTCLVLSLLVATFLRSTIRCNDLGWRGFLPAQLTLLLWAAEYAPDLLRIPQTGLRRGRIGGTAPERGGTLTGPPAHPPERRLLLTLLILGAAFTVLELASLRFHHLLRERRPMPPVEFPGARTYDARVIYGGIRDKLPLGAVVQHNPQPQTYRPDYYPGLYGGRQMVASGGLHGPIFGIPQETYQPIEDEVAVIFRTGSWGEVGRIALKRGIDYVVVQDTDPCWRIEQGWVWQQTPVLRDEHFRVYRVEPSIEALLGA
jgi:hypothetical protein